MPSGIKILYDTLTIYVDPAGLKNPEPADYIFITHSHLDHFSKKDIEKISKSGTIIAGPITVTRKLKKYRTKTMKVGEEIDLGSIRCIATESYNLNSSIHKKGDKYLGYVITCDTTRIYITGDTDFIPEILELESIDVAILPIGEGKTAMDHKSAAMAANFLKPGIVIPVHYELYQNREEEFLKWVEPGIEVKFMYTTKHNTKLK